MIAIVALITGTLTQVPVSRTTAKGTAMATTSIAVETRDGKPVHIGVMAFGSEAETLLQLDKGDSLAIRGKLELNRWVSSDGEAKERWQIVADALLPGPGRPTETRKPQGQGRGYASSQRFQSPEPPPYDDEVPF